MQRSIMLKIEALKLNVHIPTLVYAVYHILGIYVFALVRRMRTEPENFSDKELIEELNYARRIDKIVRPLGIVVVVLLIATLFAKLEVAVGDESHRVVSFPLFVYKVLGVPIPPPPPPIIVEPPPPPHVFPPPGHNPNPPGKPLEPKESPVKNTLYKLRFYNPTSEIVVVRLRPPDKSKEFDEYQVKPREDDFILGKDLKHEAIVIGEDWEIQVGDSVIHRVDEVCEKRSSETEFFFHTRTERVLTGLGPNPISEKLPCDEFSPAPTVEERIKLGQYDGKLKLLRFHNSTATTVMVTVCYPDKTQAFSYKVFPGQDYFIQKDGKGGFFVIGSDWGIKTDLPGSCYRYLGKVSDIRLFEGNEIFQTDTDRVLNGH